MAPTSRWRRRCGRRGDRAFGEWCGCPQRWDRIVALAAQHGAKLPAAPDSKALNDFLSGLRKDRFSALSGPGARGHQVDGARRICGDHGERSGAAGTLWAGGEGLYAFDGAEPAVCGPGVGADRCRHVGRRPGSVQRRRIGGDCAAVQPAGEVPATKWSARWRSGKRQLRWQAASAKPFTGSLPEPTRRGRMCGWSTPRSKGGSSVESRGWTWAIP